MKKNQNNFFCGIELRRWVLGVSFLLGGAPFLQGAVPVSSSSTKSTSSLSGVSPLIASPSASPSCLGPQGFADIVAPLLPAVVNVSVIKKVTTYSLDFGPGGGGAPGGFGGGGASPMEDLFRFRDFLEQFELAPKKRRVPVGVGSGFIVDPEGFIVTNAHVVSGADEIVITMSDQREMKATLIGADSKADLALLKVTSAKPLPFVQWGDASKMRVGDWSIAIGNPLGLGGTVTLGIISHVGRSFMMQPSHVGGFFQTDAPINVGNSGGPLFNIEGKVIGINMMIASPTGGSVGIGFAIPSDVAQFVINQLKTYGRVKRGWIGVQIQPVNQEIAKSLGLKVPQGTLVGSVVDDGPAAKAGIVQGDVILKINGVTVEDSTKLIKVVGALPIGSEVPLVVWRRLKGKNVSEEVTLKIKIGEFKDQEEELKDVVKKDAKGPDAGVEISGLTLQELTPKLRQRYQLGELVSGLLIVKVDPESSAYDSFKPGDVLLEIDQQKVVSHREAKNRIESAKASKQSSVLCLIQRQGNQFFVSLSLES